VSILWGGAAIARAANLPSRAALYHAVRRGYLKSVKKVGRTLVADSDLLHAEITGTSAREMLNALATEPPFGDGRAA
jgi:hypothetical protein